MMLSLVSILYPLYNFLQFKNFYIVKNVELCYNNIIKNKINKRRNKNGTQRK